MCFDFLYNLCLKYSHSNEQFVEILSQMHTGIYTKYKLFLSHFNETGIFLTDFHKNTRTERHTDRIKLAVTFHILCTYI